MKTIKHKKFYAISIFPKISPSFRNICFLYFPIFTSPFVFLSCLDFNSDSLQRLGVDLILCTGAGVVVLVQLVAVATGTAVPSDEVVTELGALIDWVILAFVEV